ncbi:hypothetical protein OHR86_32890 [Streptomyces sp. NBC_00441]
MHDATPVSIEEHTVSGPEAGPYTLTTGPDGALWFTLVHRGRLVPGERPTDHRLDPDSGPTVITAGPDGALWFTLNQGNALGRIGMDGAVALHPLPTEAAGPVGIAAGRDGALWFTEIAAGQIGRITPEGRITEFPLPDRAARPHGITVGPDGALWTALETGSLARIAR